MVLKKFADDLELKGMVLMATDAGMVLATGNFPGMIIKRCENKAAAKQFIIDNGATIWKHKTCPQCGEPCRHGTLAGNKNQKCVYCSNKCARKN